MIPREALPGETGTIGIQEQIVSGKVTSASDGLGIPGVSVLVKGSRTGTVTDAEGLYSISVPGEAMLVFSAIGFVSQEVEVGNQTVINITLAEDVQQLDEIVVVGYGTQKKSDVTGANQRLDASKFETQSTG